MDTRNTTTSRWYKISAATTNAKKLRQKQTHQNLLQQIVLEYQVVYTSPVQYRHNVIKNIGTNHSTKTEHNRSKRYYLMKNSNNLTSPPSHRITIRTAHSHNILKIKDKYTTASNTLSAYPLSPTSLSTMTFLNIASAFANRPPDISNKTCTLSAIAKTVSTKVLLTTSHLKNDSHQGFQMPVLRNKGDPNKLLLIPATILPTAPSFPTVIDYTTTRCLPITIRLQNPTPGRNGKFDHRQILEAILQAFQYVDPVSNIRPSMVSPHYNNTNMNICKPNDIPCPVGEIKEYIEISPAQHHDNFCARIITNSNHDLNHYKRNSVFVNWLKSEKIQLDRNPLRSTLKPHQIGFFSHMMPRADQTDLYELRSQLSVTSSCPPFFLQIKHIKAAFGITKVWNIYANTLDTDKIISELNLAYNTPNLRHFFTWKEYQSLHHSQQLTILKLQNTFITEYRSLLVSGFKPDNNTDHVMWDDDLTMNQTTDSTGQPNGQWQFDTDTDDIVLSHETIEDRFYQGINLTTTTISDFMQQAFISGDQTPVFAHVYAPILGTHEVLVHSQHIPEAMDLIKVINTDLCRIMNHRAIITNFVEFDDIILSNTTNDKWQPFDIQLSIERSVAYNNEPNDRKQTKRRRTPPTQWKILNRKKIGNRIHKSHHQ
jgi:hypothetical protein